MTEVEKPLTKEQALELTEKIQTGLAAFAVLIENVKEAYTRRVWKPMGYENWFEYLDGEFVGGFPQLDKTERREIVASLREAGMSTRAIAPVVGASQRTVSDDTRATEQNCSVEPAKVTSLDGRERPATRLKKAVVEEVRVSTVLPPDGSEDATEDGETCTPLSAFPISFKSSKQWIDRLLRTKEVRGNLEDLHKTKRMFQKAIRDLEKLEKELEQ